jgi:hypothetical protein
MYLWMYSVLAQRAAATRPLSHPPIAFPLLPSPPPPAAFDWVCFFLTSLLDGGRVLGKKREREREKRGPSHAWRGQSPWFPDAVQRVPAPRGGGGFLRRLAWPGLGWRREKRRVRYYGRPFVVEL